MRTSERRNQACTLEFDQQSANNDRICVHGLRQTRRRATVTFPRCEHCHYVARKGEPATLHPRNVTQFITLSSRKALVSASEARGVHRLAFAVRRALLLG